MPPSRDTAYRIRALAALAVSLGLVNAALWWWPSGVLPDVPEIRDASPREQIAIDMIEATRQPPSAIPPAPPPPPPLADLPPEEVPDEQILRELEDEIPLRSVVPVVPLPVEPSAPPSAPAPPAPPATRAAVPSPPGDRIVERPQRSPRIVKTSPPVCPPDVQRDGVEVEARIRVLVGQRGQVQEAEIVERTVTDRRDRRQAVAVLPYDLDGRVLAAARQHLFRPARDADQRVRSYTTLTLTCSSG